MKILTSDLLLSTLITLLLSNCSLIVLFLAQHEKSSFDVVILGTPSSSFSYSNDLLIELLKLLKPNCYLQFHESAGKLFMELFIECKQIFDLNLFFSI